MTPIRRIFGALARRSPRDLIDRATQLARARMERLGIGDGSSGSADDLIRVLAKQGVRGGDDLLERFRRRVATQSLPAFRDPQRTTALLREGWPAHAAQTEASAAKVATGQFDLLGFEGLSFGDPMDWSFDPVHQLRSEPVHWSRVPYLNAAVVGDHKIVWELSRHQYFIRLGQAAWLNDDDRWTETFIAHIDAWMLANPPKIGINWTSSLEVAFRAISWLWALHFFARAPELNDRRFAGIVGHLRVHGRHVERYISTSFSPNTHLTGEALGLVYLGTMLPELPEAERWRRKGRAWLMDALEFQINDDGGYFEQSIYYHRYTVDFCLHLLHLSRTFGHETPAGLEEYLARITDHLISVTRADGTAPFVGDDDGGRLLFLDGRQQNDVRSTIAAAAVLMGREDWAACAGPASEELVWLLGPGAPGELERLRGGNSPRSSRSHPETGMHVMRSGEDFLLVRCGPPAGLSGGHSHADALAFDLTVGGVPLLMDAGTGSYSNGELREWFRSSAAHNTVTIDDQSSSESSDPFGWSIRANGSVDDWVTSPALDFFAGQHDGFERLQAGLKHTRTVLYVRDEYWVVRDRIVGSAPPGQVRAHFQFAPGLVVTSFGEATLRVAGPDGDHIASLISLTGSTWEEREGRVSPIYGRVQSAAAWTSNAGSSAEVPATPTRHLVEIVTLIVRPGVQATPLGSDGDSTWRIGTTGDLLSLRGQLLEQPGVPLLETDFDLVWARPEVGGGWETVFAVNGSTLQLGAGDPLALPERIAHLYASAGSDVEAPTYQVERLGADRSAADHEAVASWFEAL